MVNDPHFSIDSAPSSRGRRQALRALAALGIATVAAPTASQQASSAAADWCSTGRPARRLFVPRDAGYLGRLRLDGTPLTLTAAPAAGLPAGVTHGPIAYRVAHRGRNFVNPTLVLRRDERVRIALVNRLKEPTITHWHGLAVDARNDGNGNVTVPPGGTYPYAFEVRDRAALYWYHPHPHGTTARQTYGGLFGLFEVEDDDDDALRAALDLAPGRTEISLILQDRRADPNYAPTREDLMHGFFGDDMLINGTSCAFVDVASRLYRFRMVNASNARTLLLAFRTAAGTRVPFTVVGVDGGLLPAPARIEQAFLSPAERLDVLVDLRDASVGETVLLESLAFDPMHTEAAAPAQQPAEPDPHAHHQHSSAEHASMHAAHHGGSAWPEGAPRALLQLRVRTRVAYDRTIPARLSAIAPVDVTDARERPLRLGFNKGRWRINDKVFAMGETPIEVARNTTEVWLLRNYHTSMPHAMHLHGFHFDVRERETSPDAVRALAIDDKGRLASDLGRRDTVLVWPGESVRIAIRFDMRFEGEQTYMFHCHNLEHEDGGMMLGVKVA